MDGTAVVTGASRGIGEAVARAFAAKGATVVACARDADAVAAVTERIEDEGGEAHPVRADVRDEYDLERLMETAARVGDGIEHVVRTPEYTTVPPARRRSQPSRTPPSTTPSGRTSAGCTPRSGRRFPA